VKPDFPETDKKETIPSLPEKSQKHLNIVRIYGMTAFKKVEKTPP